MDDNKLFIHKDLIYTIYEEKSFSKAAKKLFISQPSLSVIVKKIEDQIGMPLFDRSCKPIRLTEAGEAYIKAATDIQNTEDNFLEYIGAVNNLEAGTLRLGGNQLLSSFVLPKYIARFMKQYPQIKCTILDGSSPTLAGAIMLGDIDLVIDNQELDPEFFENVELTKEYLLLAVPASFECNRELKKYQLSYQDILEGRHRLSSVDVAPLEKFKDIPFILMTKDNDTRTRSDAIFKDADITPNVILEIDRLITQFNFLITGSAASVVSDTLIRQVSGLAKDQEKTILFYKLPNNYAERKIVISHKKIKHYTKSMEAFEAIMHDI